MIAPGAKDNYDCLKEFVEKADQKYGRMVGEVYVFYSKFWFDGNNATNEQAAESTTESSAWSMGQLPFWIEKFQFANKSRRAIKRFWITYDDNDDDCWAMETFY